MAPLRTRRITNARSRASSCSLSFVRRTSLFSIPHLLEECQTFLSSAASFRSPCLAAGIPCRRAKRRSNSFIVPPLLLRSNNTARREFNATALSTAARGCNARSIPSIALSCHWFNTVHAIPNSRHTSPGLRLSVHTDNTARHFSFAVCPEPLRPFFSSTPGLSAFSFSAVSIFLTPFTPLLCLSGNIIDHLLLSTAFLVIHH